MSFTITKPASFVSPPLSANKVTLADIAATQDPEKIKKNQEAQQTMREVLESLRQAKQDIPAQRKAAARAKIERIKAAIDALKMSSIVDPKMVARMAARLAKELAAAVKEYRAAGGTETVSAVSTSSAPSEATQPSEPENVSDDISQTAPTADDPLFTKHEAVTIETEEKTKAYETRQHDGEDRNTTKAYETRQHDGEDRNTTKVNDRDIAASVKEAIEKLKRLIRTQKLSLINQDKRDPEAEKKAEDALRDAERALAMLNSLNQASSSSALNVNA